MLIRVIDFETTGVPTETDPQAICEVGFTDLEYDPETLESTIAAPFAMVVNPNRKMPVQALAVHHISDSETIEAPPITTGLLKLNDGAPLYFAAHNAEFERQFFAPQHAEWICTYKVALRLWPDAPSHSNQVLRYYLGVELDCMAAMPPHRAGPDSYVTAHILARALATGTTVEEMVRWSSGAALLPTCPIGKQWRGKPWADVDTGFLNWMLDQKDMEKDFKANARHELKKRGVL